MTDMMFICCLKVKRMLTKKERQSLKILRAIIIDAYERGTKVSKEELESIWENLLNS